MASANPDLHFNSATVRSLIPSIIHFKLHGSLIDDAFCKLTPSKF